MTAQQVSVHSFPPVAQLLVEGGDERIALDARGLNKYGCAPLPDPGLIALGSSTATGISAAGLLAATRLRDRLAEGGGGADVHAREAARIRFELAQLCGVSALPGLETVLAASGTDVHSIAARVSSAAHRPLRAIMVDAAESGSGVPSALAEIGAPAGVIEVTSVPIRFPDGIPRPMAEVDAEFAALADKAVAAGQHVLLVLADVSKTGLLAPSPACAMALHDRLSGALDVLVDACQFRIAPATLRAYLQQGFMVALTGSKFMTGPSFSGALLVPATLGQRMRNAMLPSEPGIEPVVSSGLLLRWEAALEDMRAFRAVPESEVASFLEEFARAVRERLLGAPVFDLLPVSGLDRRPLIGDADWDNIQTIFSFSLRHPESGLPLSSEQTAQVYQLLQTDLSDRREFTLGDVAGLRCQLGQPVACGVRDGIQVHALRICASARMVAEAAAPGSGGSAAVIRRTLAALDKAARLVPFID